MCITHHITRCTAGIFPAFICGLFHVKTFLEDNVYMMFDSRKKKEDRHWTPKITRLLCNWWMVLQARAARHTHRFFSLVCAKQQQRKKNYDLIARDQKRNVIFACNRLIANNNWLLISLDQQRVYLILHIVCHLTTFSMATNLKFIKIKVHKMIAIHVSESKQKKENWLYSSREKMTYILLDGDKKKNHVKIDCDPIRVWMRKSHIKIPFFPAAIADKKNAPKFFALIFNLNICNLSHD